MYIYNVTINVDESIHDEWMQWMSDIHIPEVLSTGKFIKALLSQVLVDEEMGGITYSVQYTCESSDLLMEYYEQDAPRLRNEINKKFPDKFGAFRTELKIVREFTN
ncbi:MAG: DUF4286 family protein [Flavobacteriaceae bacterium]|nr:MAG: DUF4286 family protein [Flavobacteriaceae bacterium]